MNLQFKTLIKNSSEELDKQLAKFNHSVSKLSKYRPYYLLYGFVVMMGIMFCSFFIAGNQYVKKNEEKEKRLLYEEFINNYPKIKKEFLRKNYIKMQQRDL